MSDTTIVIDQLYREMLMQRSGTERLFMGSEMFQAAKKMVLASIPENLSANERKVRLFLRIYGNDLKNSDLQNIVNRIREISY